MIRLKTNFIDSMKAYRQLTCHDRVSKRKATMIAFLFCFLFTLTFCLSFNNTKFETPISKQQTNNTKYILYWTKMFGRADFNFGFGREIFENCTVNNCFATSNRTLMNVEKFDAVLFHGIDYYGYDNPLNRSSNQVYIYSVQESPMHTPNYRKYKGFFNWTMTYRSDSDIIRPYGILTKTETGYTAPSLQEIENRPRKIAWMVSNCATPSLRHRLYEKIKNHINVDVFGMCGNLTCSKANQTACYNMLESNYKFYLSFENSICEDYVTEKLYGVLQKNIIPIVYGGANYEKIAPPHSVIDISKFDTIEDLVDMIKKLDKNTEEYIKYFDWKKSYVVDTSNTYTLCKLCEKLNEPIGNKICSDISEWWNYPGVCKYENKLPTIVIS